MSTHDFFAEEEPLRKIHGLNGFLPKLAGWVDFESFRPELSVLLRETEKSKRGWSPFDVMRMFKIDVLKFLYDLSDDDTEPYIRDRLSFRNFLGLTLSDRVSYAKTIWLLGERMREHGLERKLFERFNAPLEQRGLAARGGPIVDGSFVEVPASVHDSQGLVSFFPDKPEEEQVRQARGRDGVPSAKDEVYADLAYVHHAEVLRARGYEPKLCEKGFRNKPLTDERKAGNREKSRIRCRVEHIFGVMKSRAKDDVMRCIGMARAGVQTGMRNRVYHVGRYVYLMGSR